VVNVRDDLPVGLKAPPGAPAVEWLVSDGFTPYDTAVQVMEARAAAIAEGGSAITQPFILCPMIPAPLPETTSAVLKI